MKKEKHCMRGRTDGVHGEFPEDIEEGTNIQRYFLTFNK
jgi:hypothetical protein